MFRKIFVFKEGKFQEIPFGKPKPETPFVQPDEMAPLRHPVTGKMYTSKRQYEKDTKAMGYSIVGNDWLGADHTRKTREITDAEYKDAIEYAESVHSDSSKQRAWREEQRERLGRYRGLIKDE